MIKLIINHIEVMSMKLREYQQDIVNEVFKKDDNVLIVLPTGGGKTVIAKEIIKNIKEQVLFIVPKLELIKQAADTFGEEVDVIWGSNTIITNRHITVASKQTLLRRNLNDYFRGPICIIVDEVHIGLQSLKSCVKGVNVKRIIGLTATPERNDGSSFILEEFSEKKLPKKYYDYAVFERVIDKWNIQELQTMGFLSPLEVEPNPDAEKLSKIKPKHKYDDELDSDTIMDTMGDSFFKFVNKAKEFKGKPTLVFTPDLQSLSVVMETLNKSGLNYLYVDGGMEVSERQSVLKKLESGVIDGVVNCGVLTTGFDMPKVKQCILIRNIKSKSLLFQIVGRFIRPYKGETARIYDFGGSIYNFATASVPNVFSKPVEWRYEGFEIKDCDLKEAQKTEELKMCLDDVNLTWTEYLNDPVQTLLKSLLKYKEDFEKNVYETSLELTRTMKKNFDNEVQKKVEKEIDKAKEDLIEKSESIIQNEVDKRTANKVSLTMEPLRSWFSINGFDWFRTYYPRILKKYSYDASEAKKYLLSICPHKPGTKEWTEFQAKKDSLQAKLRSIKKDVVRELPFENLDIIIGENENVANTFDSLYRQRSGWWLEHFNLSGRI